MTLSVYSLEQKKSFPISDDGLAEVSEPVFDRSGKYLYVFGSTDAGPVLDWFAQSTTDNRRTRNVYVVVLRNDLPSPLARENDDEKPAPAKPAEEKAEAKPAAQALPKTWPMSVTAYHALGEMGLIPERTELLYGAVYHKMSKSPLHSYLVQVLLSRLQRAVPAGRLVRTEQPITSPAPIRRAASAT